MTLIWWRNLLKGVTCTYKQKNLSHKEWLKKWMKKNFFNHQVTKRCQKIKTLKNFLRLIHLIFKTKKTKETLNLNLTTNIKDKITNKIKAEIMIQETKKSKEPIQAALKILWIHLHWVKTTVCQMLKMFLFLPSIYHLKKIKDKYLLILTIMNWVWVKN